MILGSVNDLALAVVLGSALGVGIRLVLAVMPRWGAPSLTRRIAPYIRDIADPRGLTLLAPGASTVRAMWDEARERVARILGGSEQIERRLRQARWTMDVAAFRGRQLAWALVGLGLGGVVVVGTALLGRATPVTAVVPVIAAAVGAILCDSHLRRAATKRTSRIAEELPTVLEFLALCLSAGEGILDSLRRVGDIGVGELTEELRDVVLAVGTGSGLGDALTRMARALEVPALTRSVDHLVSAIDRGAPLAQVLQAQATDARENAKHALIEQAGRKEILMLLPLVFAILPLSVLFAVFPGIFMLRLGIG
jgi:tight adherence protein C